MTDEWQLDLQRIRNALERIATALESFIPEPETPETPQPCPHPLELRTDFGMADGRPEWICQCGYKTHP